MSRLRSLARRRLSIVAASLTAATLTWAAPTISAAFCGFYVAGADAKLFNNATVVVLMREGKRTVLSMQNDYQGPPEDFALVIPVPVVLQEADVKVLRAELFDRVETLASPRLVEYWEQDPCGSPLEGTIGLGTTGLIGRGGGGSSTGYGGAPPTVVVEAEFAVGEYDIVILSATESTGLDDWLHANDYNIPAGAEPLLRPYVEQGMKFFVAKVNPKKVRFDGNGHALLSPLRFHYDSDEFSLPVRLGLINAPDPATGGKQDLLVHILAKNTRYQVANYPNATIPTNLDVTEATRDQFGSFYVSLFDHTLAQHPKAVVTEYSWGATSCDPCPANNPGLNEKELYELGADVIGDAPPTASAPAGPSMVPEVSQRKLEVGEGLSRDLVRRILRVRASEVRACYANGLRTNPKLSGSLRMEWTVGGDGKVRSATVAEPAFADTTVSSCVVAAFKRWTFTTPAGGVDVDASVVFDLSAVVWTGRMGGFGRSSGQGWGPPVNPFVLTRLHARYDSSSLGEDLVFEVAPAIAGGREWIGENNQLEQGAIESSINNFQARYAIRHEWAGKLECKEPARGIWGGPWPEVEGELEVAGDGQPKVAKQLATVERGAALASFVSAGAAAQLGVELQPPAATEPVVAAPTKTAATPSPIAKKPEQSGCTCSSDGANLDGRSGAASTVLGLLGLGLGLGLRRRRRRA